MAANLWKTWAGIAMSDRGNVTTIFLLVLTLASLYLCYLLFKPYAGPILFALVIAIVFHPLHRYSQKKFRNRSAAALVSMLAAIVFTAAPLLYLGLALSHELGDLYNLLAAKSAGNGGPGLYLVRTLQHSAAWVAEHSPFPAIDVRGMIVRQVELASASLVAMGAGLLRNLLLLTVNAIIGCFVLFFLFRDGEVLLRHLSLMLPLGPGRFAELQRRISTTVVANFYGGIAVGAAQGTLTALAFWTLGIDAPVVWGFVTAVFSLLPMVGSAAVWLPASIVLLATGHMLKGLILLGLGAGVIGLADNVIRPWIVSETARLHTVYVFFALLGGVQIFGVMGLFLGPVILSITAALLGMLQEDLRIRAHAAGQT